MFTKAHACGSGNGYVSSAFLHIESSGLLTTVQDRGRFGWEHIGIARGGAADLPAYIWANRLALNEDDAAVIETTLLGIRVSASVDCWIASTGVLEVRVDGAERPRWAGFWLLAGKTLEVKTLNGARAYLAVNGGIQVEPVLGSRSTNLESSFGGFGGRALRQGDELPLAPTALSYGQNHILRHPHPPAVEKPLDVAVVLGPRLSAFHPDAPKALLASRFRVSPQSNHVGLRLDGALIPAPPRGSRISEPMPIGGVQITPDGQPIILLGGRGTIGGYPLLATAALSSVWALGQVRPGDEVCFRSVTTEEARRSSIAALRDRTLIVGDSL